LYYTASGSTGPTYGDGRRGSTKGGEGVSEERAIAGTRVRVLEHHRRGALRGLEGRVVGRYGERGHVAVDVRLSDGGRWLLWARDLEEVSEAVPRARPRWWRALLRGSAAR